MDKIRVKIYWNCPTTITLHKDKPFRLRKSEPTDEGYSYSEKEFLYDGECVYRESASGGCDCDGPIHHYSNDVWMPEMGVNDYGFPNWKELRAWQRDIFAEAAGY